jgi:dTDP-4-dehydrorhamnose 3,5-epimerase
MAQAGINQRFVQDNHSFSVCNVVRGLHYQMRPQGKLIRAVTGTIVDVAVDLRRSSPSFGKWCGVELSETNQHMLWIPPGFAHGFAVLSESAQVLYKATEFYDPEAERTISWNDADLKIDWRIAGAPILSAKDQAGTCFRNAEVFA